jgi:hypothetical protein
MYSRVFSRQVLSTLDALAREYAEPLLLIDVVEAMDLGSDSVMRIYSDVTGSYRLLMNTQYLYSREVIDKRYAQATAITENRPHGFTVRVGGDAVRNIVTHEFGHLVKNYYMNLADERGDDFRELIAQLWPHADDLSEYAKFTYGEFFAELFVAMQYAPYRFDVATRAFDMMNKLLAKPAP